MIRRPFISHLAKLHSLKILAAAIAISGAATASAGLLAKGAIEGAVRFESFFAYFAPLSQAMRQIVDRLLF